MLDAALAEPPASDRPLTVLHIFTNAQGESDLEELPLAQGALFAEIPTAGAQLVAFDETQLQDWHNAPARQFVIALRGESEYEVSGGIRHGFLPGDMLFVEDLTGKGHKSRAMTRFTHMQIRVPDGFDVVRWSRGP